MTGKGEQGGGLTVGAIPLPGIVSPRSSHCWDTLRCQTPAAAGSCRRSARDIPGAPGRPAWPLALALPLLPGRAFCHSGEPWGVSVHQSWKDFLNQISPCLSLSLGGGGVVFLSRYITARRGAPQGHEACLGSLGRAGHGVSPGRWRWLRPPLTAVSQHCCAPGPGPLRPLSRPVGWGTHGMGTALHGWLWPAGPHARLAATTASSAGPMAQPAAAQPGTAVPARCGSTPAHGQLPARFTCYTGLIGLKEIAGSLIMEPIEQHFSA